MAWAATRIFCLLNGRDLTHHVDSAEKLVQETAAGLLDVPEIAEWISTHLLDLNDENDAGGY